MNKDEIEKIIPHRAPMLLIDEADLNGTTATGRYTVRGDEFFLRGHFPGNPVVPGVILCEMMAQSACLLIDTCSQKFVPYFTGMNNVKFKKKVLQGDTIEFSNEIIRKIGVFYFTKGEGRVRGELAVTGELSFAIIKDET